MTNKELLRYCNEYLSYDADTGVIKWIKKAARCITIGDVAGTIDGYGYIQIRLKDESHKAHRLAFLMHHGYLPKTVDHANNIKIDNRALNLRAATLLEQARNKGPAKNNKSGDKGVCFHKPMNKYKAYIKSENKYIFLGYFKCKKEAARSYNLAARMYHGYEFCYTNLITEL